MENAKVEKRGLSHRAIYTDILIDAAPEDVWAVLTDTANYSNWAAFMVRVDGEIKDGAEIGVAFQLNPNKPALTEISHTISFYDGKEFFWAEKGPLGIRDNHHFRVEPAEGGKTRFVQHDEIMGGMTWLLGGYLSKLYVKGYQAFNHGLKQAAETKKSQA